MDSKLLGQRIKEARLAKKMTQSEVVGSFITRNMLSQIESGNAVPSMKTLTYLAKVLELPPALLLQEECADSEKTAEASHDTPMLSGALSADSFEVSSEPLTFLHAKEAYLAGEDANAYSLLKSIPEDSPLADEAAALLTRVTLRLAAASCASSDFEAALEMAKEAEQSASKGLYASAGLKTEALLLLSDIAAKLAKNNPLLAP